jgi:hypothetical protein
MLQTTTNPNVMENQPNHTIIQKIGFNNSNKPQTNSPRKHNLQTIHQHHHSTASKLRQKTPNPTKQPRRFQTRKMYLTTTTNIDCNLRRL